MKKILLGFALAFSLTLAGCAKEELPYKDTIILDSDYLLTEYGILDISEDTEIVGELADGSTIRIYYDMVADQEPTKIVVDELTIDTFEFIGIEKIEVLTEATTEYQTITGSLYFDGEAVSLMTSEGEYEIQLAPYYIYTKEGNEKEELSNKEVEIRYLAENDGVLESVSRISEVGETYEMYYNVISVNEDYALIDNGILGSDFYVIENDSLSIGDRILVSYEDLGEVVTVREDIDYYKGQLLLDASIEELVYEAEDKTTYEATVVTGGYTDITVEIEGENYLLVAENGFEISEYEYSVGDELIVTASIDGLTGDTLEGVIVIRVNA